MALASSDLGWHSCCTFLLPTSTGSRLAIGHPWGVFKPYLVLRRRTSRASIWPHPHVALRAQAMSAPSKQCPLLSERNASSQRAEILQATQSINALNLEAPPGVSSGLMMRSERYRLLSERASASFGPAQGRQHDALRRRTCLRCAGGRSDCHGSAGQDMDHGPGSPVAGEQSVHSPCTESDAWAVDGNTDKNV